MTTTDNRYDRTARPTISVGGGGGGSVTPGWQIAADIDLGGAAGSLTSGDTFTADGLTFTYRRTNSSTTASQGAGGITIGYSGSGTGYYSIGVPIADVLTDYNADEALWILYSMTGSVPGNTGAAIWQESGGVMSRGWAAGVYASGVYSTLFTTLGTLTGFRTQIRSQTDPQVAGGYITPRSGANAGLLTGTGSPPSDPSTLAMQDVEIASHAATGANTIGIYGDSRGTGTAVLKRLVIYRHQWSTPS